jgi:hypothetical protein
LHREKGEGERKTRSPTLKPREETKMSKKQQHDEQAASPEQQLQDLEAKQDVKGGNAKHKTLSPGSPSVTPPAAGMVAHPGATPPSPTGPSKADGPKRNRGRS